MAATILAVYKIGDSASRSEQGLTESQTYRVKVAQTNATSVEVVIATHAQMPAYNAQHQLLPGLRVKNKAATHYIGDDGKPILDQWIVQVDYGPVQLVGSTGNSS